MSLIDRLRQKDVEFSHTTELQKRAEKLWKTSTDTSAIRISKMKEVYGLYGLVLTDLDYQYLTCGIAHLEATKTETPVDRMAPEAKALKSELDRIRKDRLDLVITGDEQMRNLGRERLEAYVSHVEHITQAVADTYKNSSIPDNPRKFYLATAVHANMLTQIRSGNITIAK